MIIGIIDYSGQAHCLEHASCIGSWSHEVYDYSSSTYTCWCGDVLQVPALEEPEEPAQLMALTTEGWVPAEDAPPLEEPSHTSTCLTCGSVKTVEGPWNESVAYCDACTAIYNEAFEQARAVGHDHAESADLATLALKKSALPSAGTARCEQCGGEGWLVPIRMRLWFEPNRHDDGYAKICDECWKREL